MAEKILKEKLLAIIKADRATFESITFDQDDGPYCGWDDDENIDMIIERHSLSVDEAIYIAKYMRMARTDMLSIAYKGAKVAATQAVNFVGDSALGGLLSEEEEILLQQDLHTDVSVAAYDAILAQERKHMVKYIEHLLNIATSEDIAEMLADDEDEDKED